MVKFGKKRRHWFGADWVQARGGRFARGAAYKREWEEGSSSLASWLRYSTYYELLSLYKLLEGILCTDIARS